jgi:hypothetical protein
MSVLKEEYSLPNSNWLQKLLKFQAKTTKETMDVEQKTVDAHPDYIMISDNIRARKTDLEILTQVIEQCIKSGKYVTLTKIQWDRICGILDMIGINSFDSTYWDTNRTASRLRNLHSLNKYRDLYSFEISTCSYSRLGIPSYEQWMRCVEGVCDCSEEEILHGPIPPPTISEEEWRKLDESIYDEDDLYPIYGCNKPILQPDHGTHKAIYPHHIICIGCHKSVDPHHMRSPISLNFKQRQYLKYILRDLIHEYEQPKTDDDYRDSEGKVHERWTFDLELKLMKNARHKLRSSVSGEILADPHTLGLLRNLCELYIEHDEIKISEDCREEWGKMVDVLSEIREIINNSPQTGIPLCYQCVESKRVTSVRPILRIVIVIIVISATITWTHVIE